MTHFNFLGITSLFISTSFRSRLNIYRIKNYKIKIKKEQVVLLSEMSARSSICCNRPPRIRWRTLPFCFLLVFFVATLSFSRSIFVNFIFLLLFFFCSFLLIWSSRNFFLIPSFQLLIGLRSRPFSGQKERAKIDRGQPKPV